MQTRRNYLFVVLAVITGVFLGIAGTIVVQKIRGPKQTVNITGQGVVDASTDQATITVVVQNSSWALEQAEKDNKQDIQDLKEKLMALGIPESRIVQSGSILPIPMMVPGQPVPPTTINENIRPIPPLNGSKNPTVATNLSISVDTLSGIDKIFAAINTNTHAKITDTNYSLKNSSSYEAQAREKAIQDARSQAESIAKINKLHLGKLVSLTNIGSPGPLYKQQTMTGSATQPELNTSVSYGEKTLTITASFNVTYELY